MNQQPGFLILVVIFSLIGGWLLVQMIGGCIAILSVGLGCGADFAVVGGFFLAVAIALFAVTRKENR